RLVRARRAGHGRDEGPGGAAHRANQPPDRASARARQRSPVAPRPADAGGAQAPLFGLPPAQGPRRLPGADQRARSAQVSVIAAGTPAPSFSLARERGESFTEDDLQGQTTVFVFYPFAFSPVCTDQLQLYEGVLAELADRGAKLYGVSCDSTWAQR